MNQHRSRLAVFAFASLTLTPALFGQNGVRPAPMIREAIDEAKRVTLAGNTRPEANAANDRGRVADDFAMDHMLMQLKRSPATEAALRQYIDQLHDPHSPAFHRWLTPEQFAAQYGAAQEDTDAVSRWLKSRGFRVEGVQSGGMVIDFSGTAGQIRTAFHTEIHNVMVGGKMHFANMTDPQIPAALEPAVGGVISMHNFKPKPQLLPKNPGYTYTNPNGTFHAIVAGDLATIYNFNPLFAAGISGQGQSIMVVEDTYLYSAADWTVFRTKFGLTAAYPMATLSQVSPAGAITCTNPGFQGSSSDPGYGDDPEAAIDVEWATAAAPNAAIILAACTDTTAFGGLIALENVLNGPAAALPSVVSISYGFSEEDNGAAANLAYNNAYQQAVAEGVSIFVSSGDWAAAVSDLGNVATHGISVSGFTSTPYNVSVGGLDFGYTALGGNPNSFWSSVNSSTFSSAFSYIPEIPWNDSCAGGLVAGFLGTTPFGLCNSSLVTGSSGALNFLQNAIGGSGGPSGCATGTPSSSGRVSGTCAGYPKPSWQSGLIGNPADGVRDIPDVSLFASNGFWDAYYVACWSNPDPVVGGGFTCTGAPSTWAGFGGTSISSPIMAGIQALVNQRTGNRWGNPNTVYYSKAKLEYDATGSASCNSSLGAGAWPNCVFYDVTQGDNDSVCRTAAGVAYNCYIPTGDTFGVLSTSNTVDQPAYLATKGWDFTSGIGSVNASNLVMTWPAVLLKVTNTNLVYLGTAGVSVCVIPATNATATGSVQILDGTTVLTIMQLGGNGCTGTWYIEPPLITGTHLLTAIYSGDSNNAALTSSAVVVTVSPAIADLSANCGGNSFSYGGNYSCYVNVGSSAGSATGSISYIFDGGSPVVLALTNGSVSFTLTKPNAGPHTVTISYAAQGNFSAAGPSSQSFTVAAALTQVSLTPSNYYPQAGASFTLSATVSSYSAGTPGGGTVTFFDNGVVIGSGQLNAQGQASLSFTIASGYHSYTAAFGGLAPNFAAGTSGTVTISAR